MRVSHDTWARLLEAAKTASERAYCEYSRFPVGAALLTPTGNIYAGCNVENSSFGTTICAERNAVGQMVAAGEREIQAILVYTPTEAVTPPCGACRQVISEFTSQASVQCVSLTETRAFTIGELLPFSFGPQSLVRKGESHGTTD